MNGVFKMPFVDEPLKDTMKQDCNWCLPCLSSNRHFGQHCRPYLDIRQKDTILILPILVQFQILKLLCNAWEKDKRILFWYFQSWYSFKFCNHFLMSGKITSLNFQPGTTKTWPSIGGRWCKVWHSHPVLWQLSWRVSHGTTWNLRKQRLCPLDKRSESLPFFYLQYQWRPLSAEHA